jgi:hypothetical protein
MGEQGKLLPVIASLRAPEIVGLPIREREAENGEFAVLVTLELCEGDWQRSWTRGVGCKFAVRYQRCSVGRAVPRPNFQMRDPWITRARGYPVPNS